MSAIKDIGGRVPQDAETLKVKLLLSLGVVNNRILKAQNDREFDS